MAIDSTVTITLDELKVIIHGLRMSTFTFVEDGAIDEIRAMIKVLPLPEDLGKMGTFPAVIKNLQRDIGNIMRLIEVYSKRDTEFKTRYKSRTGLPPRYKVMAWRDHMKTEAAKTIKEMVKVSSTIDDRGYGDLSGRINKFASNMTQDKFDEVEFEKIAAALKTSGLEKEAQFWQGVKGFMGGAIDKAKEMGRGVWQAGQAGGLEAKFKSIFTQLENFKKEVGALRDKAQDPKVAQQMAALFNSIDLGEQQMNEAANAVKNAEGVQTPAAQTSAPVAQTPAQAPVAQTPVAQAPVAQAPTAEAPQSVDQTLTSPAKDLAAQPQDQPAAQARFNVGDKLTYNNPKARTDLRGAAEFLGYTQQFNPKSKSMQEAAKVKLKDGKIYTVSPKTLATQEAVVVSSKFNLRTYKTASK